MRNLVVQNCKKKQQFQYEIIAPGKYGNRCDSIILMTEQLIKLSTNSKRYFTHITTQVNDERWINKRVIMLSVNVICVQRTYSLLEQN